MLQHEIKRISAAKNIKQKDFLETLTWGELQKVRDRADMQESREKGKKIISQRSNCVWNHHRRWNLPFRSLPVTLTQHLEWIVFSRQTRRCWRASLEPNEPCITSQPASVISHYSHLWKVNEAAIRPSRMIFCHTSFTGSQLDRTQDFTVYLS